MADVDLIIRAHLRGERELNKAERKLWRIAAAAKAADNNLASMAGASGALEKQLKRAGQTFTHTFTDWDKLVRGFGNTILKVLGFATKFFVVEFGLMSASMIAWHALLKIGRWLMKGYHGAIKMIAGAAAGAAAALAVLSAAIREQQAAMFSYKGLSMNYKELRGGIAAVRSEMRGMARDMSMNSMGVENLNAIFAGSSQRGTFNRQLAKGLLDIGSAGQPLEQAAKWIGEIVGLLSDPKAQWHELEAAFKSLGFVGERTLKKLRDKQIDTIGEVREAVRSGNLSIIAGVEGQYDAVAGTFMSKLKSAFSVVRSDFADLGDAFMADTKVAFEEISKIFRRMFFRIRGDINQFGKGGFLGTLVSATEAVERGMVKLVSKWLPQAEGIFGRIGNWWERFLFGWNKMVASMAPLIAGTKVLEEMFGNILRPMGDYVSTAFDNFNTSLQDNKDSFLEFGDAVGDLVRMWSRLQIVMKDLLIDAMPFISKVLDGLGEMVGLFTTLVEAFQALVGSIPGVGGMEGFGSAFTLMGMRTMGKGMRDTKGTLAPAGLDLKNLGMVTMNAQTVHLMSGQGMGYRGGPTGGIQNLDPRWASDGGAGLPTGATDAAFGGPDFAGSAAESATGSEWKIAGQQFGPKGGKGAAAAGATPLLYAGAGMYHQPPLPGTGPTGMASDRSGAAAKPAPGSRMPQKGGMYAPPPQSTVASAQSITEWNRSMKAGKEAGGVYGDKGLRGQAARAWFTATNPLVADPAGKAPTGPYQKLRAKTWGRLTTSASATRMSERVKGTGARMGVGMGMGILGGMMPEEAQGAMALGSMVSMIDPRVGMGIGFGGAALKSKTAGGGAMTGAAAGAALGMFGGAPGIAIGAVLGGIVGGIMGMGGAKRAMVAAAHDAAAGAADDIWAGMLSGIEGVSRQYGRAGLTGKRVRQGMNLDSLQTLKRGALDSLDLGGERFMKDDPNATLNGFDISNNNDGFDSTAYSAEHKARMGSVQDIYDSREMLGLEMTAEELTSALEMPREFIEKTLELLNVKVGAAETIHSKYESRMSMLTNTMGLGETQILRMADAVGVNLYDATMDTTEMFRQLSAGMITTRNDIDNLFAESASRTFDFFGQKIARDEATVGMDESARQALNLMNSGDFGKPEALAFLQEQMGFGSDFFEGDRLAANNAFIETYGEGGLAYSQKGGQLEGRESEVLQGEALGIVRQFTEQVKHDNVAAFQGVITGGLGSLGYENVGGFNAYGDINGTQYGDLIRLFEGNGPLGNLVDDDGNVAVGKGPMQAALFEILGSGFVLQHAATGGDAAATDTEAKATEFGISVGKFETAVDTLVARLGIDADTSSPKAGDRSSSMAGTMAAHSRISQGLAGKRTITSGQRNFNLGSSTSDHLSGRALDMVGANLGGYASRVNASGGFAEMHGIGDTRHLHAVPATGDSSSPASGGGVGGSYNYTINVTGGPNANANEVANLVMVQIQNAERSQRERA